MARNRGLEAVDASGRAARSVNPARARRAALLVAALLLTGCLSAPTQERDSSAGGVPAERACPQPSPPRAFENAEIREASGIARSQREACVFWVHDDSGAQPVLYAVDGAGKHLGSARLSAPAVDWEDVASFTLDGSPFLIVGDIGNNARSRDVVTFLVVEEPALPASGGPVELALENVRVISVRYPGAPFDAESLAVDVQSDEILVVSKGEHADLPVALAGANQALYAVSLWQALRETEVTLRFQAFLSGVRSGPGEDPAREYQLGVNNGRTTAMDLHPGREEIAILTYREILVWARGPTQTWAEAVQGAPRAIVVPHPGMDQMEGLAYSQDGASFLVADERGDANSELTVVATGSAR